MKAMETEETGQDDERLAPARKAFDGADYDGCADLCGDLLTANPKDGPALHLLGAARVRQGAREEGERILAAALALIPRDLVLRFDLSQALYELDRVEAAIRVLAEGARYHPGDPGLALRLARLLAAAELHDQAIQVLLAGLRAAPGDADLHMLLGGEYATDLRFDEALAYLSRAGELAPDRSDIQTNLGYVHQAMGEMEKAILDYRRAIALSPTDGRAHMNLATALMTLGDFGEGLTEFEWRVNLPENRRPGTGLPRWRGEPLNGRRLLVTVEQGYGDMIQYARFLPRLASFGGEVIVECPHALERLFESIPGVSGIVPLGAYGDAAAALTVPLLSLPFVLGVRDGASPESGPYLVLPPDDARMVLPFSEKFKVGLVWAGRKGRGDVYMRRSMDRRSCPVENLAPLLAVETVEFYGLQVHDFGDENDGGHLLPIRHFGARLGDFADTAAAMVQLDLIISIDTAAAHLAGALGLPVWIMLAPGQFDYRWGRTGERTSWYPSARLFRCDGAGWAPMTCRMAKKLRELAPSTVKGG